MGGDGQDSQVVPGDECPVEPQGWMRDREGKRTPHGEKK